MTALPALLGWSGHHTPRSRQPAPNYVSTNRKRPTCALLAGIDFSSQAHEVWGTPAEAVIPMATETHVPPVVVETDVPVVLESSRAGVADTLQKPRPTHKPYFIDALSFSSALTYFRKEYPKFARMQDLMDEINANRRREFSQRQDLAVGYLESCRTGKYDKWNTVSRNPLNRLTLNHPDVPREFYETLRETGQAIRERSSIKINEAILAQADWFLFDKGDREGMYAKFSKMKQPLRMPRKLVRSGLVQLCLEELIRTNPWASRPGYFQFTNGRTQTFGEIATSALRIMLIQMEFHEDSLPSGSGMDGYGRAGRPKSPLHPEVNPWSARNFRNEFTDVQLNDIVLCIADIVEIAFLSTMHDCSGMLSTYHELYGIDSRNVRNPYVELFYDVLKGFAINFLERKSTPELRKRTGAQNHNRLVRFLELTYGLDQKELRKSERPKV